MHAGHQVVAGARRPEALDDLVAEYGEQIAVVPLDVTKTAHATAAVRTAPDRFGRLDVLVNNPGYANVAPVEDVDSLDVAAVGTGRRLATPLAPLYRSTAGAVA